MPARAGIIDTTASRYGAALARLFSSRVLTELASTGQSRVASQILRETGADELLSSSATLGECFDVLFDSLRRNYRNEYVYKNAIANKILLGRHSLNTAFMLTEFRVGNCKADVVILNGSSHVYEIKSEFDSIARLKLQVETYQTAFDCVSVITSPSQTSAILDTVDGSVGVMVLTDRHSFSTVREARSCRSRVDPAVVFDSLRQAEYKQIILDRFGTVPDVPNTKLYRACKELFCHIPPPEAHDAMVGVLRKRGECLSLRDFIERAPWSLKALSLACRLSWQERALLVGVLQGRAVDALLSA